MSTPQNVRGTRDLFPEVSQEFRFVESTLLRVAGVYGFREIETPVLEPLSVFSRSLGDTSDVVTKQMYVFSDLGGDQLVLRPEGTAGIARAFVNGGMAQHIPVKWIYSGPMFRYERPQKGRYRQFYQVGCELLGVDKPQADVEVISMAWHGLKELGLADHVKLQINTIGDTASRDAYRAKLVEYLATHKAGLSADSQNRLEKNPLRILDSKDPADRAILKSAPVFSESLNEESRKFFESVCSGLRAAGMSFEIDPFLVRGFDYYCHTVFEFTTSLLGSQNAVLSGGRYDGLIQSMGGPATPGVGWGAGTDRLVLLREAAKAPAVVSARPVAVIPFDDQTESLAIQLCSELRQAGLYVDMSYSGNVGKRMKRADKVKASAAVLLGPDEVARGAALVKNLDAGTQQEVLLKDLVSFLRR